LFTKIASAGRHYRVSVWAAAQYYNKMPPVIRTNSDYLFILGVQNDKVVKALWDEFGGLGFPDWRAFRAHAAAAVKDFGALVVDTHDSKNPVRRVRAPSKPAEFQLRQR
jgi:hypothetical protein